MRAVGVARFAVVMAEFGACAGAQAMARGACVHEAMEWPDARLSGIRHVNPTDLRADAAASRRGLS